MQYDGKYVYTIRNSTRIKLTLFLYHTAQRLYDTFSYTRSGVNMIEPWQDQHNCEEILEINKPGLWSHQTVPLFDLMAEDREKLHPDLKINLSLNINHRAPVHAISYVPDKCLLYNTYVNKLYTKYSIRYTSLDPEIMSRNIYAFRSTGFVFGVLGNILVTMRTDEVKIL